VLFMMHAQSLSCLPISQSREKGKEKPGRPA
jgi:hypothetical protein